MREVGGGHTHREMVCQYGTVHGQCRCPGPKETHKIDCPVPSRCQQKVEETR